MSVLVNLGLHWGLVVSSATIIGAVAGYFVGFWKSKSEIALLKSQKAKLDWDLAQAKLDAETRSVAQLTLILTDRHKKRAGTNDLVFSFDELWMEIGEPQALRLHAAINILVKDGRAKKDSTVGYWRFD